MSTVTQLFKDKASTSTTLDEIQRGHIEDESVANWIPTRETPEDGALVVVSVDRFDTVLAAIYTDGEFIHDRSTLDDVLAWQYLSEAHIAHPA